MACPLQCIEGSITRPCGEADSCRPAERRRTTDNTTEQHAAIMLRGAVGKTRRRIKQKGDVGERPRSKCLTGGAAAHAARIQGQGPEPERNARDSTGSTETAQRQQRTASERPVSEVRKVRSPRPPSRRGLHAQSKAAPSLSMSASLPKVEVDELGCQARRRPNHRRVISHLEGLNLWWLGHKAILQKWVPEPEPCIGKLQEGHTWCVAHKAFAGCVYYYYYSSYCYCYFDFCCCCCCCCCCCYCCRRCC